MFNTDPSKKFDLMRIDTLTFERDQARRKCDALEEENTRLRTALDTIFNERDQLAVMVDKMAEFCDEKGYGWIVSNARDMLEEFGNPHIPKHNGIPFDIGGQDA